MTPDDLRSDWNKSSESFSEFDRRDTLPRNMHTTLDNLAARYRRFVFIAAIMIVMTPLWISNVVPNEEYRLILILLFTVYFLAAGITDFWLYSRLKGLDIAMAPVSIVAAQTRLCRKVHLRSIIFLLPFAIILVTAMIWVFSDNQYMIYGIITGLALGLLIGFMAFRRFMADYRLLNRDFSD